MSKILIIGCNDITRVIVPLLVTKKGLVDEICIASKNKEECDELKRKYKDSPVRIVTAGVDVTIEEKALLMMRIFGPSLIINLAPTYLNKHIMGIALKIGASYIDMKFYTDESGRECLIDEQFACAEDFYNKNKTCVTGCSFNTAAFICLTRLALSDGTFDSVSNIDIIDITESNGEKMSVPSIEDFERLSAPSKYIEDGEVKQAPAMSISTEFSYDGKEPTKIYQFASPVIESYERGMPEIKNVRYFACLDQNTAYVAEVLSSVGMLSTEPVKVRGVEIAPIDFLASVLPSGASAGDPSDKKIKGVIITGTKNGEEKSVFMYFECNDSEEPAKFGVSTASYLSAITLLSGSMLMGTQGWDIPGVFTPGDFDPKLLLDKMKEFGVHYSVVKEVRRLVF